MNSKNGKTGYRKLWTVGLVVLALLLLAMGLFYHYYGKMTIQKPEDMAPAVPVELETPAEEPMPEAVILNPEELEELQSEIEDNLAEPVAEEDVYSILLLGVDARYDTTNSRTDTIMVVSINKEEKTIAITSFLRDIYISIPDFGYHRLNTANVVGGPAKLIDTLEKNFGIAIDNYAFVNFYSFIDVINVLGGVDIELTDPEVLYINHWVHDGELQVPYESRILLEYREDGQYHLDGMQALAYCRQRNLGADPGRAERQRNMMSLLWEKTQDMNIATLTELADAVLPHITTDLAPATCLSLLSSVIAYRDFDIVSQQIPADGTFDYAHAGDMSILAVNFEANREILQQLIYGIEPEEAAAE